VSEPFTDADSEKLAGLSAKTDYELAEYVRCKLDVAISLACQGEEERRSGHLEPAEAFQRKWEDVMVELKPLLPLVKKSGVPRFPSPKIRTARSEVNDPTTQPATAAVHSADCRL
jgi:hypothetical protein